MPETTNLSKEAIPPGPDADVRGWLRGQMNAERRWLLAHADDGVIWGRWDDGEIITSHDVAPGISPELRLVTLQQAFIFGERDEVRLWRDETGWLARRISDENDAEVFEPDEMQVLWGTEVLEWPEGKEGKGFTHVREKSQQGMDHVVPVEVTTSQLNARQLKLRVRHFITEDLETGEAHIALSRLVSVEVAQEDE
jgi:CRISPR-associated protein (TIGR03984 family)